jgi:C1A family cysteine protease
MAVMFVFMFSSYAPNSLAYSAGNYAKEASLEVSGDTTGIPAQGENNLNKKTGDLPFTQEDIDWMHKNMKKTTRVENSGILSNKNSGQRKISGTEKSGSNSAISLNAQYGIYDSTSSSTEDSLPAEVDNSTKKYFPPVGNQGGIGSCASFSTTYYTMTYMNAMARDIDVRTNGYTSIFSPKWTYNFLNGNKDSGSNIIEAYRVLMDHGAALWNKFPYDENYSEWCLDPEAWKEAMQYRMKESGYVDIGTPNDPTPVTNAQDSDLTLIKGELASGKILNFSTSMWLWKYTDILYKEGADIVL